MTYQELFTLRKGDLLIYTGHDYRIKYGSELTFLRFCSSKEVKDFFSDDFIICQEYPSITISENDLYIAGYNYIVSSINFKTYLIKNKHCL